MNITVSESRGTFQTKPCAILFIFYTRPLSLYTKGSIRDKTMEIFRTYWTPSVGMIKCLYPNMSCGAALMIDS